MAKRSDKKFKLLERHKKLTPEVRSALEQRKKSLLKNCKEKVDFIDDLLKKPTLKIRKELT